MDDRDENMVTFRSKVLENKGGYLLFEARNTPTLVPRFVICPLDLA